MGYMYSKYKSGKRGYVFFTTLRPNADHSVYLSSYGYLASGLLEKYVGGQRADYEELFAEWDESVQKASIQTGFSATHQVEDGYVYVTSFQSGIGISSEDEIASKKHTATT